MLFNLTVINGVVVLIEIAWRSAVSYYIQHNVMQLKYNNAKARSLHLLSGFAVVCLSSTYEW